MTRGICAWVALLLLSMSAAAQGAKGESRAEAIGREARQLGAAGEYARARELFREQVKLSPSDFQARYNLARVESTLGDAAAALAELRLAIESGYDDLRRLRRDPLMGNVRALEAYPALEAGWSEILDAQRDANIEASKVYLPAGAREYRDAELRVVILSAWDPRVLEQAREELTALAAWARAGVFPTILDPAEMALDPWVVIVLPEKDGFDRWQTAYFGARPLATTSYAAVGGAYDHDSKRLVARDLGSTLRHEFFHVLHWRMCTRVGQVHPIWLQEGLCSLVEDCDTVGNTIKPVASYRTNTARRLLKIGSLLPIAKLVSMDRETFLGSRPMANYAQARTLFLFLNDRGVLARWYAAFVQQMVLAQQPGLEREKDPRLAPGASFEEALGKPMKEIEADYRAYVRSLPEVAEQIAAGSASLGVEVEPGSGDGPLVVSIKRTDGVGLRVGDVILAVDDRPTRDTPELVRVLSSGAPALGAGYAPGDHAVVRVRRGGEILEVPLTLVAR